MISRSPFGEIYRFDAKADTAGRIKDFIRKNGSRQVVAIQGLGFVGSAMLTAVAGARSQTDKPLYAVIGIDLPTAASYWKIGSINRGKLPVKSSDKHLFAVFNESFQRGNIIATSNDYAYQAADIVIIDVNLDVKKYGLGTGKNIKVCMDSFVFAVRQAAKNIRPSSLVIVESTLPPGTCGKILVPVFREEFNKRGYKNAEPNLVYSYERVMPGKNYLKSITHYYRVFSAINENSRRKARRFFKSFIDTKSYPLTELSSLAAAEMGKVLENSYRAANIALIQEWTELAESAGVDLFEVIGAIRRRDTHNNIMAPGFGVGGYCLTKDPLLADWSRRALFSRSEHMGISVEAVNINDKMPLHSLDLLKRHLKSIKNKRVLLMGISYLKDVADTRFSPAELFYKRCIMEGARMILHDPLVDYWPELNLPIHADLKTAEAGGADAIILAVGHDEYINIRPRQYARLLKPGGLILDCSNVLDDKKADVLRKMNYKIIGVGKGHWNRKADFKK